VEEGRAAAAAGGAAAVHPSGTVRRHWKNNLDNEAFKNRKHILYKKSCVVDPDPDSLSGSSWVKMSSFELLDGCSLLRAEGFSCSLESFMEV
jgi:hypothetical protein